MSDSEYTEYSAIWPLTSPAPVVGMILEIEGDRYTVRKIEGDTVTLDFWTHAETPEP